MVAHEATYKRNVGYKPLSCSSDKKVNAIPGQSLSSDIIGPGGHLAEEILDCGLLLR
jgi:hypothetical protein